MSNWPPVWLQLAIALALTSAIVVVMLGVTGALR